MSFPSSLERYHRRTEWSLIMNISELFDLHGRTVLITGGSGVLGRVMASGLLRQVPVSPSWDDERNPPWLSQPRFERQGEKL